MLNMPFAFDRLVTAESWCDSKDEKGVAGACVGRRGSNRLPRNY